MIGYYYDELQSNNYENMVSRPINLYLSVCGFLTGKQSTEGTAWVATPNKAPNINGVWLTIRYFV